MLTATVLRSHPKYYFASNLAGQDGRTSWQAKMDAVIAHLDTLLWTRGPTDSLTDAKFTRIKIQASNQIRAGAPGAGEGDGARGEKRSHW